MTKAQHIAVLGAGSFGSAIAVLLANNGHKVTLWGRDEQKMAAMQRARANAYFLPDVIFDDLITCTHDLTATINDARLIILAVPSSAFASVVKQLVEQQITNAKLLWLTKGLNTDHRFLHEVVAEHLPELTNFAVLSGPSFAREIAKGLPTAVTIAGLNTDFVAELQQLFVNDYFRVYSSKDLVGVQLGGTIKNVLAIASGISDGLGFGANARAALITRGLAEMIRLGLALGAQTETLMGLSGLGDLILTCTDNQSRNRRFGLALGEGKTKERALKEIAQVVEGLDNVRQVNSLAASHKLQMPIAEHVAEVLAGKITARQAVESLFDRPVGSEF